MPSAHGQNSCILIKQVEQQKQAEQQKAQRELAAQQAAAQQAAAQALQKSQADPAAPAASPTEDVKAALQQPPSPQQPQQQPSAAPVVQPPVGKAAEEGGSFNFLQPLVTCVVFDAIQCVISAARGSSWVGM
jgi:hypothetical protein